MENLWNALYSYLSLITPETLGIWVAALLTLMVYSYLLGDNPLFRLAEHLFVGSAVAYAAVVAYHSVLKPQLILPLASDPQANWFLLLPAALGLLLLTKARASIAWVGNSAMAFLFGVGAALAIGGALSGTLLPQVQATFVSLSPTQLGEGLLGWGRAADNLILVVGTVATLLYFYFNASRDNLLARVRAGFLRPWAGLGRWIIMITFGAIFANTVMARVSLLIGRVQFLLGDWLQLLP
ncbi:MAG: hypothetical protein ACE5MB_10075 [Anaerolineae bacterium]